MLVRKLALFFIAFFIVNIAGATAPALNETDYVIKYIPTGDLLQIKQTLNFTPENVKVYLERHNQTGHDYIAGVTVYGKEYATSRGISVGDPVEKVKERYGEPNRLSGSKNRYRWISYMEESQILKVHFYLDKESGRVVAINLNIYPVGAPPLIVLNDGEYH